MHEWLVELNKYCHVENLLKFYRVHIYQGALEAILSFYLVQILLVFTIYFSEKSLDNVELYRFIIISLMICTSVFIVYIIIIVTLFTWTIYENRNSSYEKAHEYMQCTSAIIHILGTISYFATANFTNSVFSGVAIAKPAAHYLIMGAGVGLGVLWNMQDYFADNRLNMSAIFLALKGKRSYEMEKKIFDYTFSHAIFSLFTVCGIIAYVFLLMSLLKNDSSYAKDFLSGDFIRNAYVLLFFTICFLYSKTVFVLYYKKKKKKKKSGYKESIYLGIGDFKQRK